MALERNEAIEVFYYGKLKGRLIPARNESKINIQEHPFFGMYQDERESVENKMDGLRSGR